MAAIHFTTESFNEALKNNKVVFADFFAVWCNPCKMLAPILDQISDELEGKAVVGKINVEENPDLAEKYEVMSVPTMHIFVNGELKNTLTGYKAKAAILEEINKYL